MVFITSVRITIAESVFVRGPRRKDWLLRGKWLMTSICCGLWCASRLGVLNLSPIVIMFFASPWSNTAVAVLSILTKTKTKTYSSTITLYFCQRKQNWGETIERRFTTALIWLFCTLWVRKHARYYLFITLPNVGRFLKFPDRWIKQEICHKMCLNFHHIL